MKYDFIIVGSGLYGLTLARLLTNFGMKCLIIEKRDKLGGNIVCDQIEGINIHKYGAHIFHTSNKDVWNFVNKYVEFNNYINSPIAVFKDEVYNLPFNMNTFCRIFGERNPEKIIKLIDNERNVVIDPANLEEQAIKLVGKTIYSKLIEGYTEKQWGRKCTDLPASIIKRLPLRFTFDNNYFNDRYQGIPIGGYNTLIEKLSDGIEYITKTEWNSIRDKMTGKYDKLIYTGAIDEYFGYSLGRLEYRTVRFEHEIVDKPNYQGVAVVNYTSKDVPFTRIIEHKHFEMFNNDVYKCKKTVITREYSSEWKPGMEQFYPVNDDKNNCLYSKYRKLADDENNVIFGGRLAEYKYYDMDKTIESAINTYNIIINGK